MHFFRNFQKKRHLYYISGYFHEFFTYILKYLPTAQFLDNAQFLALLSVPLWRFKKTGREFNGFLRFIRGPSGSLLKYCLVFYFYFLCFFFVRFKLCFMYGWFLLFTTFWHNLFIFLHSREVFHWYNPKLTYKFGIFGPYN